MFVYFYDFLKKLSTIIIINNVLLVSKVSLFRQSVLVFVIYRVKRTKCSSIGETMKKKLLNVVRDKVRFKHYSLSREKTYIH